MKIDGGRWFWLGLALVNVLLAAVNVYKFDNDAMSLFCIVIGLICLFNCLKPIDKKHKEE